jgi:hypothetical protein
MAAKCAITGRFRRYSGWNHILLKQPEKQIYFKFSLVYIQKGMINFGV